MVWTRSAILISGAQANSAAALPLPLFIVMENNASPFSLSAGGEQANNKKKQPAP